MNYQEILARIESKTRSKAIKSGESYQCRCPAHDDKSPSLSVKEGEAGQTLVKCHAGCTFEAIAAAVGLSPSDFFADSPRGTQAKRGRPPIQHNIVTCYTYQDETGYPWQAARILEETLADIRKQGADEKRLVTNRLFLLKAMRDDLREQVNRAGEMLFRKMLEKDELSFRLVASGDANLNWELAETLELEVTDEDRPLLQQNGKPLERHLFEKIYQKQVNGLEKDVAWYLDGEKAVRWWHRIAARQDWHLQGWQRNKVYPDFLACVQETGKGKVRFAVLETKGLHLKGNDDTGYKERLFGLLEKVFAVGVNVGELKLGVEQNEIRFELMLENNWLERIKRPMGM